MKLTRPLQTSLAIIALSVSSALSQDNVPPISEPEVPLNTPDLSDPGNELQLNQDPPNPADINSEPLPGDAEAPLIEEEQAVVESEDGFLIQDAALNDIFQLLAQRAGKQYFHNINLSGDEFRVTGNLLDRNPEESMDSLAFQFGLQLYRKGETIYALTQDQLNQLPANEWHYQLNYLRPSDIAQIQNLIQPVLTPGTGIVNFEPKTNTIIVIDSPTKIDQARNILEKVDQPKDQIIVEVKILSVNQTVAREVGVNWSQALSATNGSGIDINVSGIDNLLGLGDGSIVGSDIVLAPGGLSAVLTALNDSNITEVKNNPVLITEDNEQAIISIIERIPIITTTTTAAGGSADNPTVTEEVRYTIDESDSTDPETTREIGTTIAVTPTLLPDNTIRLTMRPRNAVVTGVVTGSDLAGGNEFPEVLESTIQTIARIPNGHSLVIGGFYQQDEAETKNEVPLLGDIPIINFFFKNKESSKITSSLIFVVTPTSYDPTKTNDTQSNRVKSDHSLTHDAAWLDSKHPGNITDTDLEAALHRSKHELGLDKKTRRKWYNVFRRSKKK